MHYHSIWRGVDNGVSVRRRLRVPCPRGRVLGQPTTGRSGSHLTSLSRHGVYVDKQTQSGRVVKDREDVGGPSRAPAMLVTGNVRGQAH